MSAQTVELADAFEAELQTALALLCRLTREQIERVTELMQSSNTDFSQSALQLGLVSQHEIDAAIRSLQVINPVEADGLIEATINKISEERQLVVHLTDSVKPSPQLRIAHEPYSQRNEAIRTLRTELLLRNETRQANVMCVVSPSSGEGRSQLAAELAIAFAQLGRRTLLVDADMRRPRQHILFSADNARGLSESLMHGERPFYYPVEGLPLMSLLTSGALPSNPLELLSSGRFERLLQDWKKNFEFVIVDTPPVTQCADALAIATLAARVLFVVRAQRTGYRDTRETLRRLATTRAQVLGTAMNRF
jgi:protein-tyrosine kinase